ncbi:hypothetical protein [Amphritea pacifica]|uniref:PhoD-like phosphatase metallophosphatase domain-containing protein n=1 Tax=Amphritea pacifica TaxID=2811233 RepID=A0ABS2W7F2_9GAMM|nr:hypothetical protein [Amphritea pacifica]MBN0987501.1 hypothetical protein [Amphritea pacifica]MBN1005176.1 hypothetical protein [Amphritea pacifica]
MSDAIRTNTGQWSLVVLRATQNSVKVWAGTLFSTLKMPDHARIELVSPDHTVVHEITKADWNRPFSYLRKRFYVTASFNNLQPGTHYKINFLRRIEAIEGVRDESWQQLRTGQFETLPAQLPDSGQKPFTVGFGSCFYNHRDGGQAAGSYKALYDRGDEAVKPTITFLTGDQVYLDIGFDSLSFVNSEIRQRVADDYALHWQALGSILNRGATWMLPDDHEYWNDYPFYDSLIPTLLTLKIKQVRETWSRAAYDGVQRVQQSPRLDFFKLGDELSFCLADLRSYRDQHSFLPDADFDRLTHWARSLTAPGVLVIPQPLIVEENKTERNLLSFKQQYQQLIEALGESGHDIVLLSGDVHFGRIAVASLGPQGGRLIEVIASPLSNLTGLNGIATATPSFKPKKFPDPALFSIPGWSAQPVRYDKSFAVSTKKGWPLSAYPMARTREHFMTASFNRAGNGEVRLKVNAWRVRERDSENLPARDFDEYEVNLK